MLADPIFRQVSYDACSNQGPRCITLSLSCCPQSEYQHTPFLICRASSTTLPSSQSIERSLLDYMDHKHLSTVYSFVYKALLNIIGGKGAISNINYDIIIFIFIWPSAERVAPHSLPSTPSRGIGFLVAMGTGASGSHLECCIILIYPH